MVFWMAEYSVMLQCKYRLPVKQYVVFIGSAKPKMATAIATEDHQFRYNLVNDSVYVEPSKKLHVNLSVNMIKYKSSYTAILVGEESGKEIKITGKWTGVYPVNANIKYQVENL